MVDYKLLADNDPGGELSAAYATMKAELTSDDEPTYVTYVGIFEKVGLNAASALDAQVKLAINAGTQPNWLQPVLETTGLDANKIRTANVLTSLVGGDFTAVQAQKIIDLGTRVRATYPRLKIGHLETARKMRIAGEI